jgi:nucleotide-binding universal stress UspA family protein
MEEAMLKKILLTLDGSENAEKALPWAKQFASREKAQVVLFRVVPPIANRDFAWRERDEAREYLLRMEKELNFAGIPTKVLIRRGNPAREIVDAAVDQECDLIVISTRGGSKVKRWVMGGVTEQVMRMSKVPVMPVRSELHRPRQGHVRRLIVPLDGSKRAESSIRWSIRLAHLLRSKLVFLHVYPNGGERPRGWRQEKYEALAKRMTRLSESLHRQGLRAEFRLQRGDAADRILNYADANDLILTTTHGFGGMKRWILGSVAEKLVHAGTIPVLVFKTSA